MGVAFPLAILGIGFISTLALSVFGQKLWSYYWIRALRRVRRKGWHPDKALRWRLTVMLLGVLCTSVVVFGIGMGRPVFGLLLLLAIPASLPFLVAWKRREYLNHLDRSALTFFYALLGLIRAGMSLPSAMFELSRSMGGGFGAALSRFLDQYEKGVTLQDCLEKFRLKSGLPLTTTALTMLEMAYREGFSVIPLLEKILPMMQLEHDTAERIGGLRKTVASQIGLAFLLPWSLVTVMALMQPQVWFHFWNSGVAIPIIGFCFFFEGVGIWLLWNTSKFR